MKMISNLYFNPIRIHSAATASTLATPTLLLPALSSILPFVPSITHTNAPAGATTHQCSTYCDYTIKSFWGDTLPACSSLSKHLPKSPIIQTPLTLNRMLYVQRRRYSTTTSEEEGEDDESKAKIEEWSLKYDAEEGRQMIPKEIVAELDKYIIGQNDAKRAVAVALRNRWRRHRLPANIKDEVIPKNILMIGPTGVGKTEIARRLAKLISAPFIKVEATKFTEVGFHGRDVDQIIRDLVDVSITNTRQRLAKQHKKTIDLRVEKALLDALLGQGVEGRDVYLTNLRSGALDGVEVEIEIPEFASNKGGVRLPRGAAHGIEDHDIAQVFSFVKLINDRAPSRKRKLPVAEARRLLERKEKEQLFDQDAVIKIAIRSAEQDGIVFIDEIDKICERKDAMHHGADASSEGVQRDLLPIIEGSVISTKHGNVDTSHMLFIASGAFHSCKPSDLISELQGRLPIRVELKALLQDDLYRILTEPENNQVKQQIALMKTEGIDLKLTEKAIQALARIAADVNTQVENIGARRLHTVLERIIEDISYNCDKYKDQTVIIDEDDVKKYLGDMLLKTDLSKFIL